MQAQPTMASHKHKKQTLTDGPTKVLSDRRENVKRCRDFPELEQKFIRNSNQMWIIYNAINGHYIQQQQHLGKITKKQLKER